jgi:anti-anti-sigma factor
MALEITSTTSPRTATIELKGELDAESAVGFRQEVDRLINADRSRLVLVLDGLTFMASAGFRVLIFAKQKNADLEIFLVRPQEPVLGSLEKTGFDRQVTVTDTDVADEAAAV